MLLEPQLAASPLGAALRALLDQRGLACATAPPDEHAKLLHYLKRL